jgi:hypothetical protein
VGRKGEGIVEVGEKYLNLTHSMLCMRYLMQLTVNVH